ncbi:MAG TPA: hypothetical protein VGF48_08345 [Thermoanaerobaculia bacterium]|jgi:hypothetical protein
MPSTPELLTFVIVILAIWIFLKIAKLAVRVILFVITVTVIAGMVWYFFLR